jgi:translin
VDRATELDAIGQPLRAALDDQHRARELTIGASRRAIQQCAASIRATHRGEFELAQQLAEEARAQIGDADAATGSVSDARTSGPLPDAKKELAEASLTLALVRDEPLPDPQQLGVDPASYLNGMAEAASELRREVLDRLREGDLARAETLMCAMDEVYALLVTIDFPDAVTGGLRRNTDALRAVLERTRGDLSTTMVADRLRTTIEAARASLEPDSGHERDAQ